VCRWAHAAIDGALELKHRHDLRIDDIETIDVASFWEITRLANCEPSNTIAAQFSIQFALAVALRYDRVTPAEVTDAQIRDPAILALARKVRVAVDDELDRAFPAKTIARVTIRAAGRDYSTTVEYPLGNPENPLGDDELDAKFELLATDVIGSERARRLRATIRGLPEANDVLALARLLGKDG